MKNINTISIHQVLTNTDMVRKPKKAKEICGSYKNRNQNIKMKKTTSSISKRYL